MLVAGDRGKSEGYRALGQGAPGGAVGTCGQGRAFPLSLLWAASEVAVAEAQLEEMAGTSCLMTLALCDTACFTPTLSH